MLTALAFLVAIVLAFLGRGYLAWVVGGLILFWACATSGDQVAAGAAGDVASTAPGGWWYFLLVLFLAAAALFGVPAWRRTVLSARVKTILAPILPRISDTERAALEAGTVWWDGELFSGAPKWKRLLDAPLPPLSERERAFLDGPVEQACTLMRDYDAVQAADLPEHVWAHLKRHGFFGMIIPEEYGGLGFSAAMHSAVVTKLSSRSTALSVSVMVPNSLGPAELLLHYGTDEQRRYWLPRLAKGEEMPCFALTGPENGSDAAAMEARGVVCKGQWKGEEVLGLRLSWAKRYTTLGPIATVIGLAFKLYDPEHLIGDDEDRGITCALVPADLPGITIGSRHDPLGIPFHNGPSWGRDVFVPLDEALIGGRAMAGQGWRMLMDCLAAGRAISLPSLSSGCCQVAVRYSGAYALVRKQFNLSIGKFEGVGEALGRVGARNYMIDATRKLTSSSVDLGEKPSVLSAVAKAYCTNTMRDVINDAMDIAGGAGISRGPANVLAGAHMAVPIGITVEGANILTRTMIIFGQGAIRCHPFVQDEMAAVDDDDLVRFDKAFFGHVNFVLCNVVRAFTRGLLPFLPANSARGSRATRKELSRLSRWSAAFSVLADTAMATLGGDLKRKEMLAGRFADALAGMYLSSATLKRFLDEGERPDDLPFMQHACAEADQNIANALAGILDNLPLRPAAWLLRPLLFPLGARRKGASDRTALKVARSLLDESETRLRHSALVHTPPQDEPGLGFLEFARAKIVAAAGIDKRLREALKDGRLDEPREGESLTSRALSLGVIKGEEAMLWNDAQKARARAVAVDDYSQDAYRELRG
ncbi:MAG: acyl-CoA dehydrogenase [Planctomycetota bacterium]|nr:MAG: acyl-CoA dehydrogenase [Planctomycetota bacterium]